MLAVKEHPGISDTNNSDLFCAIAGTKKGNRKCDLGTLGRRRRQLNVPHQEAKRQSKKARAQILTVASSGYCNLSCIFLPRICTEKVRGRESGWEGRGGGGGSNRRATVRHDVTRSHSRRRESSVPHGRHKSGWFPRAGSLCHFSHSRV